MPRLALQGEVVIVNMVIDIRYLFCIHIDGLLWGRGKGFLWDHITAIVPSHLVIKIVKSSLPFNYECDVEVPMIG